jgi:DNA-nicking Smr family endonuclease
LRSRNGEPVLKTKTALWLAQRQEILAFCQARPGDGGAGAVLVLLRGRRKEAG